MSILLIGIPSALVLVTVVYGIVRSFLQIWLDHRVKLAFLEKIEKNPGLLPPYQEIQQFLSSGSGSASSSRPRQDYVLTGLLVGAIGVVCTLYGRTVGIGEVAVGMYLGGILCAGFGLILALFGILLRSMVKNEPDLASKQKA